MDESLYPPRDKAARRLWDTMSKFKKGAGGRKQGRELLLPPESGYLRACAHQFAERLGLVHSSTGEGPARTVLLQLPSAATKREAAQGASSSTDAAPGADGEPPAKRSRLVEGGGEGSEADAEAKKAAAAAKAEANRQRKPFMARLTSCARDNDPREAKVVFDEMCAAGVVVDNPMASLLVHVFGNATPPMLDESRRVFEQARLAGVALDEASWSGMVRLLCLHGELTQASATIDAMVTAGLKLKLRSISPLLLAACDVGELALAMASCERLRAHSLSPTSPEFVSLVRLHAAQLRLPPPPAAEAEAAPAPAAAPAAAAAAAPSDADAAAAATAATAATAAAAAATAATPASRLDDMLRWLADENPPLSAAQIAQLHAAFDPATAPPPPPPPPPPPAAAAAVPAAAAPASSRADAEAATTSAAAASSSAGGLWRAERCTVNEADGRCSATGAPLRAVHISAAARAELRAVIPRLAGSRAKGEEFSRFGAWVDEHGPFEYVLDGANIGFFGQAKLVKASKATSFSYEQVDAVLRAVCARSTRVLLVLHVSHTDAARLDTVQLELLSRWRERGVLFSSPAKHNDDWYWLYAAMASGDSCRVVSNDEMRDHHFGMMTPRNFLRWKERHVVRFTFRNKSWQPELNYPPVYTTAVQDHPGKSWLFPCAESREWLLVRPAAAGGAAATDEGQHEAEAQAAPAE